MQNSSFIVSTFFDDLCKARVEFVKRLPQSSKVHLSGICGTGMSAVLKLLVDQKFEVSGSDKAFYPPMGDYVKQIASKVFNGYRAENLSYKPDLVVIGNALSVDNPEVQFVFEHGIPYASMSEVLAARLIGDRSYCANSIVVSGTHGKTTTTALIAHVLECARRRPGFFIGGMPLNFSTNIRQVNADIPLEMRSVVLEGDEYDSAFFAKFSKFQAYRPDILLITSMEFDHADIFKSIEEIEYQFFELVQKVPENGLILVCDQGEYLRKFISRITADVKVKAKIETYGFRDSSSHKIISRQRWCYQEIPEKRMGQEIEIVVGKSRVSLKTQLTGEHNALNLLAASCICMHLGVGEQDTLKASSSFLGVKRRQQVFQVAGRTIVEDFAHHPTAVSLTLAGIKESFSGRRIIAVFEPRSNTSRRNYFQKEYAESFNSADIVVIQRVADASGYSATGDCFAQLDVDSIGSSLKERGTESYVFNSPLEIQSFLLSQAEPSDVIVLMSNGNFGGLLSLLLDSFKGES